MCLIKKQLPHGSSIKREGTNKYRIFTPFTFNDGDGFVIVLKLLNNKWILTDEGNTLMSHRSPDINENDPLIQDGQIVVDVQDNGCNSLSLIIQAIKNIGGMKTL